MRGEIWTISAGGTLSKPRPAVIVQSDALATDDTILVCPLTSFDADDGDAIAPTTANGLARSSKPMAHRAAAIKRERLGQLVGKLSEGEMEIVSESLRRAFGL